MATISWWHVVQAAPDCARVDPAAASEILARVAREVPEDTWGDRYVDGQVYLAAHLGTLVLTKGTGAVSSEGLGPMTASYAMPTTIEGSLGLTSYGAEYKRLLRQLPDAVLGMVGG